jgi:DNA-binding MarR family transcriptional regulator
LAENITEIIQLAAKLGVEEKRVLKVLRKVSAALPAELAVKSFMLPEEMKKTLLSLKEKDLINTERTTTLSTSELVFLNERGRITAQVLTEMK